MPTPQDYAEEIERDQIEAGKYRKRADTPDAHREAQRLAGQMALPDTEQHP